MPAKGFDLALKAFALLAARHPDLRMSIAGDGAARDELHDLARTLAVERRVDFLGWVDPADVPRLLNTASIVVMPSRREGLPVAAIQAALMARPIVATPVGGVPEGVHDGENGVIVDRENPADLAAALDGLLSDRERATAMGQRGREDAMSALNWNQTVALYYNAYVSIGGKTRVHAQPV